MKIQFKIFIFTAVICLGALSFYFLSQKEQKAELFSYGESSEVSDQAEVLAFKVAVEKANKKQVNTVEAFLKLLPENLRNRYTLVYGSRSLQEASLTHPRAIVFSKDVSVIYSFNGDPKHEGYHQIEIMYLDYKTGKVEMQEIRFSGGEGSPFPETVVENNPEACIGCHGTERSLSRTQNLKPIWDNYFVWPGVYGSVDDDVWRLEGLLANDADNLLSSLNIDQSTHPELSHFRNFFENKENNLRYSQLEINQATQVNALRDVRPNLYLNRRLYEVLLVQLANTLLVSPSFAKDFKNASVENPTYLPKFITRSKELVCTEMSQGNWGCGEDGDQVSSSRHGTAEFKLIQTLLRNPKFKLELADKKKIDSLVRTYYRSLFQRQSQYLNIKTPYGRALNSRRIGDFVIDDFATEDIFLDRITSTDYNCILLLWEIQKVYDIDLRRFSMDHYPKVLLNHAGGDHLCAVLAEKIDEMSVKTKN